ncbi:hypothetical protein ACWKWA_15255 [Dermacoccus abyssi]
MTRDKITHASAELGLRNYGKALLSSAAALHEANQIRSGYGRSIALQQMTRTLHNIPPSAAAEATAAAEASRTAALETGSLGVVRKIDKLLEAVKEEPVIPTDPTGVNDLLAEPNQKI